MGTGSSNQQQNAATPLFAPGHRSAVPIAAPVTEPAAGIPSNAVPTRGEPSKVAVVTDPAPGSNAASTTASSSQHSAIPARESVGAAACSPRLAATTSSPLSTATPQSEGP